MFRCFRSLWVPEQARFQDLIRRVRSRDEEAARELTMRYENAIRRVVRIHLRDARVRTVLDSSDVCQSVLASFFVRTALGQYELDTPDQLLNLLTTITRNKLANQVNRLKAQRRDIRKTSGLSSESLEMVDTAPRPDEQIATSELVEQVYNRLSPTERYLAEQRTSGRTWQDLAGELGGTDAAVRKRLSRALSRVMVELGLEHGEDIDD
ncbi:MAG: sigma-70 family RNA polymerase sigma factor [Planctomycetaceae bacterium]